MNRISWIDNLRGLSVLAVIFLHCSIAVNEQMGHFTLVSDVFNQLLAPIRLGLMFFVSGLFVDAGLKKGVNVFLENKVRSILYPFVVWVMIYGGLQIAFNSISQHPKSWVNIVMNHLTGGGDITWFLHSLFFFFVLILFARRLPFLLVFLICMLSSIYLPTIGPDSLFSGFDNAHVNKSLYLFVFFFLGDLLVRKKVDIPQLASNRIVIFFSFVCFAVLSSLNLFMEEKFSMPVLSPLALMSIPFFIWISLLFKLQLAYFVGVNSIVFYLSHYIVVQFFSKAIKGGDGSLWAQDIKFLSAFLFCLAGPWLICLLRSKGRMNFLFSMKKRQGENNKTIKQAGTA